MPDRRAGVVNLIAGLEIGDLAADGRDDTCSIIAEDLVVVFGDVVVVVREVVVDFRAGFDVYGVDGAGFHSAAKISKDIGIKADVGTYSTSTSWSPGVGLGTSMEMKSLVLPYLPLTTMAFIVSPIFMLALMLL